MSLKQFVYACLTVVMAPHATALALPADPGQPIEIEAATMVMDQRNGVSTYTGNVTLIQGSIRIAAEKLVVYARNRKLDRLEAFGTAGAQASFRQQLPDGGETRALAGHMEYRAAQSRLILRQQAELHQGGNHIRSERIDYNTASNSLLAGQDSKQDPAQPQQRVRIVIEPGDDNRRETMEQKQP
jgi:lipopolysaccharide export system protein LptA